MKNVGNRERGIGNRIETLPYSSLIILHMNEVEELRKLTFLIILIIMSIPACLFAQGKITGYTTWDDNYFYAAFRVDDYNVTGTNTAPFSNPWEDDSVEIFLETNNNHDVGRSVNTYHMAVSAAGGAAFSQGSEDGKWAPKKITSFKYSSSVDGSLNNPEDEDTGYIVELAIPWAELGMKAPEIGKMMSFNVVVRMQGETKGFISLSPSVKTEQDIHDASKWVNIVFTQSSFGVATLSLDKIVSARYIARMPLINGQINAQEYNKNTSFDIALPSDGPRPPKHQLQKMLLTYYFYWYQGDPRKAAPFAHIRSQDGVCELTNQPIRSAGPWFSYDRVQWHKEELSDMKRAGIDIVLPVYWGDAGNKAAFAAKGLDCMIEALQQLKEEKKPYPLIGMFFDTTAMSMAYGKAPDMREGEVKQTFYGMIKDFFSRVPEEFRAQVQMVDQRADRPCYIIDLYTSNWVSDFDSNVISYVNDRFRNDFDANILWIGAKDYKDKANCFDAYCNYGAGLAFGYDDSSKIRIAAVGAGYNDTAVSGRTTPIRGRNAGDVYADAWSQALAKKPNWIMVDGWNEFHEGSDICGSRQYGFIFVDATALQSLRFRGAKDYDAKYLRNNLPRLISPDTFYQVDVVVQNDGTKPWKISEGYALSYRWYQNGVSVGDSGIKVPIQENVLPGRSQVIKIGIAAVRDKGQVLPDGDYELRFEMVRMSDNKWFSSLGSEGFTVPVKVGKPEAPMARYLSVDGPVMMKSATDYPFEIRVRNDGPEAWETGASGIVCRLYKVSNYIHGGSVDLEEDVPITLTQAPFLKKVAPGDVAEVKLVVNLKDPNGVPIPAWKQSDPWSYQLRFDVMNNGEMLSKAGVKTCDRIIDVFDNDHGLNIVAVDLPDELDAGKSYDVKIVVKNNGQDTWTAATHSFGYHWYYLDGTEALWDGVKTPIKGEIKPGEPQVVVVKLTTPQYDGRYILAWDMIVGDKWVSTSEISRYCDLHTTEVTVKNGKLAFVDLSKHFDVVACSTDKDRSSGDFDGNGLSIPAEFMPPDTGTGKPNDIYPSGYGWKSIGAGLESPKRISFKYGSKSDGSKNAIKCDGQLISLPKGKFEKVHILGAAVEPDQQAEFGLGYQSGVVPVKLPMSRWSSGPENGEEVGFMALHRHTRYVDEREYKSHLFHYVIPVDSSKQLLSIILPKNDKIRVVAITLEKA